jgi:hypothetical protein
VECEAPEENAAVRAYFEVPGAADAEEADFFRLPFPNDIRLTNGKPNLDGFPTPGPGLLGVDLVQRYVDRLEAAGDHFSGNGSIIFRFSGALELSTLDKENEPIVFVDLTEPTSSPGTSWRVGGARTNYVCDNWVAVRPGLGDVLKANHTYAVWLTTNVKAKDGKAIERAPNFEAMLKATAPTDAKLKAAHAAYAPLRTYLAESSEEDNATPIDPDTLLNAAVFTVGDTVKPMADLAQSVATWATPPNSEPSPLAATGWVKCGGDATSPCPQADGGRACGAGTADYDEYQALVTLPVFQKGDAPYLESGGDIDTSGPVRTEEVCMALSVPKGSSPAAGFPLVIYAHGTGGSYRSHLVPAVAGELAKASPKFAVLGIDQVQHGPRRGDSMEEPDNLFFNFTNPDAARGNPLQGAADQLALFQLAQTLGTVTVGNSSFTIDPAHVVFYGHSQGSTHGSLMLPYSDYPGAVLSGNGGSLTHALLAKTNPVNIAGALPIALQDAVLGPNGKAVLAMEEHHPALSLLQQWIDPSDPLNLAPLALTRPPTDETPKHVFQTFGLDDTYSPPTTLTAYTLAAGLGLAAPPDGVTPTGDNDTGLEESTQVTANVTVGSAQYTGAMRQYAPPAGSDGHFVAFDVPEATADIVSFLEALGTEATPVVP